MIGEIHAIQLALPPPSPSPLLLSFLPICRGAGGLLGRALYGLAKLQGSEKKESKKNPSFLMTFFFFT